MESILDAVGTNLLKQISEGKMWLGITERKQMDKLFLPTLNRALLSGGLVFLFPVLKNWPLTTLNQLLWEIELATKALQDQWQELAFDPHIFLNTSDFLSLDDAQMEFIGTMSEIASVVIFYKEQLEGRNPL